jgi:flagellar biosynthesis protein FlhG
MSDQATQLRVLVAQAGGRAAGRRQAPPTLVISGGRPGVGATTLAVHLAAMLAQEALRIVLVDADLYRADIASHCELTGPLGIGEVLSGRRTIHEALQLGPAGVQVLTGAASAEVRESLTQRSIQRLLKQVETLHPHADWLIVDAGNQPSELAARLWSAADRGAVITSPDAVAVMDSYALMKTLLSHRMRRPPVNLIVNQAADEASAADVHRRIDQSCRRFLGLSVTYVGHVPHAENMASRSGRLEATAGASPLASSLAAIAEELFRHNQQPAWRAAA